MNWQMLKFHGKGYPEVSQKGKSYADDRIPTDDEIQKIIEYPDRRIKAIIYTMISSGIRLRCLGLLTVG